MVMMYSKWFVPSVFVLLLVFIPTAYAAYDHGGVDTDSPNFLSAYPDMAGTKLDSCVLCHANGQYEKKTDVWVTLGSCQWCHYSFGYDASGDIDTTLNQFGKDYRSAGQNEDAFDIIKNLDSDGDGYTNAQEIAALRFPGDANDDPTKVPAPYRVYTLDDLESMPPHKQFMLMNTHKSGDFYAEYSGVTMSQVLSDAGILPEAQSINVYAPDGWSQYHPLELDPDPLFYHVYGTYPAATFYYHEEADQENTDYGWCDYSSPPCGDYSPEAPIDVENGLQLMLAFKRDGVYLKPGILNTDNKLDGEGPFRVVPPQKVVGPPDQASNSDMQDVIWPFDDNADHNAGFATRTATMIRVDPLPEGTTAIDTLEAGWNYVDQNKIIVYGAIDPLPTIEEKINNLVMEIEAADNDLFKQPNAKRVITSKLNVVKKIIRNQEYNDALNKIENDLLSKIDGCKDFEVSDKNDWITDCELQSKIYWGVHEIMVLLQIIA
ncbi:exported hypothetical protein [Desulfosarcina cetonica]|uniref:GEGP motif-containing diheme protein n=1 Tax=Desulfosarcina cetonica TaxID=90730 RepID=UPI0006D03582|nr:GEGP motif-containing diheme protein [Desulfosarcina cetonica]VTR67816.1 exported hypothetical protein [Desulfosarcina cetonica]